MYNNVYSLLCIDIKRFFSRAQKIFFRIKFYKYVKTEMSKL